MAVLPIFRMPVYDNAREFVEAVERLSHALDEPEAVDLDEAPDTPEVLAIRVYVPGPSMFAHRDYATGRRWDTDEGTLIVVDEHDRGIAEYPPGRWASVEDILAKAAA